MSVAASPSRPALPGLWNPAETRVVPEEKFAGVQGFGLEGRAVGRDEPPMTYFPAQQFNQTDGRKLSTDPRIVQIGGLGEDEPDAVILRLLRAVAQHEHDLVPGVDGETRKHGP